AVSRLERGVGRAAEAERLFMTEHPDAIGKAPRKRLRNGPRLIRRGIVDDDELPVAECLRRHALERLRKEAAVIVARDVNGDFRTAQPGSHAVSFAPIAAESSTRFAKS